MLAAFVADKVWGGKLETARIYVPLFGENKLWLTVLSTIASKELPNHRTVGILLTVRCLASGNVYRAYIRRLCFPPELIMGRSIFVGYSRRIFTT